MNSNRNSRGGQPAVASRNGSCARPIELVIRRLEERGFKVTPGGPGQWRSQCPAHRGKSQNLSIKECDDGTVLLKCHRAVAGRETCTTDGITQALGLETKDLFVPKHDAGGNRIPRKERNGKAWKDPRKAIDWFAQTLNAQVSGPWIYYEPSGDGQRFELMRIYRLDYRDEESKPKKQFRPVHPDAAGWHMADPPGQLPLYNLPDLRDAELVYLVEGEKCADRVRALGLVATTSSHGSSSAKKSDWSPLSGKTVVMIPDHDQAGEGYIADVGAILATLNPRPTVRILRLPLSGDGDDIEQWLESQPDGAGPDECRAALERLSAAAVPFEPVAEPAPVSAATSGDKEEKQNQILLRLASAAKLFHDSERKAYAVIPHDGHEEVHPVRSRDFRLWLQHRFFEVAGRAPSSAAFGDALHSIEAQAVYKGPEHSVYIRVGGHADRLFIDPGSPSWHVIEVTAEGWQLRGDAPIRFRRTSGQRPLPEPIRGGDISELRPFVNCDDNDFLLVVAWTAAAMRPFGPYPVLNLTGEQGSAKSTLARLLRRLIDNHVSLIRAAPEKERDLIISAINGHVIALDNLSSIPPWLSDALCRVSSGGGMANRTHYTMDEETYLDVQKPVITTGIEDVIHREDLTDRSLPIHLQAIPPENRRTERDFWSAFDLAAPKIFGGLLDVMSKAMAKLPTVQMKLPRMGDFALFGEAVSQAMGNQAGEFERIYGEVRQAAVEAAIEDSVLATIISEKLLLDRTDWHGRYIELLTALRGMATEQDKLARSWPKSPRGLSGKLRRLAPQLRAVGINLVFHDHAKKGSAVSIARVAGEPE